MKRRKKNRDTSGGWTLIELMVIVAILGIVTTLSIAAYENFLARAKFSQIQGTLNGIVRAAHINFTGSQTNDWAPMVIPGSAPIFVGSGELDTWPVPPCPGWVYSWDNYYGVSGVNSIRISLRRSDLTSIWSVCVQNFGGDCQAPDEFGAVPQEISTVTDRYVYCLE